MQSSSTQLLIGSFGEDQQNFHFSAKPNGCNLRLS